MTGVHGEPGTASSPLPLPTRALALESGRARQHLASDEWRLSSPDAEAVAAVLARLTAPLPARRGTAERIRATDRDRRLQRILRTAVHHLDAGAVSPPAAALLPAVARALSPCRLVALARCPESTGCRRGPEVRTRAGDAGRRCAADRGRRGPVPRADLTVHRPRRDEGARHCPAHTTGGALAGPVHGEVPSLHQTCDRGLGSRHRRLPGVRRQGRSVDGDLRLASSHAGLPLRHGEPSARPRLLRDVARAAGELTDHVRRGRPPPRPLVVATDRGLGVGYRLPAVPS